MISGSSREIKLLAKVKPGVINNFGKKRKVNNGEYNYKYFSYYEYMYFKYKNAIYMPLYLKLKVHVV